MAVLPVTIDVTPAEASCCAPAADAVVDDATAHQLAKVFKALGDPDRVKLFSLITASASGEMCVCDLTEPVGLSQPTVSHHMKLLVEAGLVTREQRGKWAYYQPTTGTLATAARAFTA
jgi:ArsR family transcriptional regulator